MKLTCKSGRTDCSLTSASSQTCPSPSHLTVAVPRHMKAVSGHMRKKQGRGVKRREKGGRPTARSGVQRWSLSPCLAGMQSCSGKARIKLYRPLQTPSSVSNYLPLIGFNERFNSTALPNQIKLLLSTALNPGSLLCQACSWTLISAASCLTHSLSPLPVASS